MHFAYRQFVLCFLVIGTVILPGATFGQGPENTLVVVNAESPDSLAIANHYIDLRNIPAPNVVYLKGVTYVEKLGDESTASVRFIREIYKPVSEAIKERGLEGQIDCITYSAGFPTRVNVNPESKRYVKNNNLKYNIQRHAPWTSLTSITYLYHSTFADEPRFLDANANWFASMGPSKILDNPFQGKDAKQFDAAQKLIESGDYGNAMAELKKLGAKHSDQMALVFAFARAQALNGDQEQAIRTLGFARSRGFHWRSLILKDKAFAALTDNQKFKAAIKDMDDFPVPIRPTRNFSGSTYWGPNGWPNGTEEQGQKYILSTMLAVTGDKERSSLKSALAQITRSVNADGTHPNGRVYFAKHSDPRSRTRSSQFKLAAAELKSLGVDAEIGEGKMPSNVKNIIGATLGSASLDWEKSGSKFLPGALCDNFTSYGAWWEKSKQTQLNEFLEAGAAGACGTVYEPYTIPIKIPTARLHAHYARGCTLAEAFYQSVSCPFQLLVVGDPLCCPYGNFPEFQVKGLDKNDKVTGDFELQINGSNDAAKAGKFELFMDGVMFQKVSDPNRVQIVTNSLSDGYHELRIVGKSKGPITNRTSKVVGFVHNRRGRSLTCDTDKKTYTLDQQVVVKAVASQGKQIEIRQNSRSLGTLENGKTLRIPASKLGQGKLRLQATIKLGNGRVVRSPPVSLEILGR